MEKKYEAGVIIYGHSTMYRFSSDTLAGLNNTLDTVKDILEELVVPYQIFNKQFDSFEKEFVKLEKKK